MGKTLSEFLCGRVIVSVEGAVSRNTAAAQFAIVTMTRTAVRGPRMSREAGAHPIILMGSTRRSTSRWLRWPAGLRRFVPGTVGRFITRHRISCNKIAPGSERERPGGATRREAWLETPPDRDRERLLFIDGTGASTKLPRPHGLAGPDELCLARVPHGQWLITPSSGALQLPCKIVPMLLDGPMNRGAVLTSVEQALAPTGGAVDIVNLDNRPTNKQTGVQLLIDVAGATLRCLPAYSPDFNPIETAFAKLNALRRSAAGGLRPAGSTNALIPCEPDRPGAESFGYTL